MLINVIIFWDGLSAGTSCPLGRVVRLDGLSIGTGCPGTGCPGTGCPLGWAVRWDGLSVGTSCLVTQGNNSFLHRFERKDWRLVRLVCFQSGAQILWSERKSCPKTQPPLWTISPSLQEEGRHFQQIFKLSRE